MKEQILSGKTALGIELGSTRIKAVLIDEKHNPIAAGSHEWENQYVDGIWTYSLEAIWNGVQDAYANLAKDVKEKYDVTLTKIGAIGFSAMMHGYMPFDKEGNLLVPFRTWRNTITGEAAAKLSELFNFNVPQRWSISHLYQAILNKEPHVKDIDFMTTLEGYIHWQLTGEKVIGIGEASGMFPIDSDKMVYHEGMVEKFDNLVAPEGFSWKFADIFPKILLAGDKAGVLTEEGAKKLDVSGNLEAGIPLCPPEGDAGTGMTATNSIAKRTGNVSAGTSIFSMIVLEKELKGAYEEIDMVTTPSGFPVAMVHCNNCTSDLNAWVNLFREFAESFGMKVDMNDLYGTLYRKAMEGDRDCGKLLSYGYLSGEPVTGFMEGRPMFVRTPESKFSLVNFMRSHLFSCLASLKIGNDILFEKEDVQVDKILGHGGLFKTKGVGQKILAAALNTPVSVMETAGEGGAWGMALLAAYMLKKEEGETLDDYLNNKVFVGMEALEEVPDEEDVKGFNEFIELYKKGFAIEHAAVDSI